ncbi:hypothetical protein K466DRAFT_546553 [Polyporus arcularius HHB13444]|uniref:DUF6535 domain-containing protein n=1 Tax=Polyporus arcularius HHB13444 TaxID=1314778 RepID=A0A5C3PG97_9APHY|nr:hypothetical protein K466DRAFT_546553 [Polyporus arcularius HHB13444]
MAESTTPGPATVDDDSQAPPGETTTDLVSADTSAHASPTSTAAELPEVRPSHTRTNTPAPPYEARIVTGTAREVDHREPVGDSGADPVSRPHSVLEVLPTPIAVLGSTIDRPPSIFDFQLSWPENSDLHAADPPSQQTSWLENHRDVAGGWTVGDKLPTGMVLGLFGPEETGSRAAQLRRAPAAERRRPRLRAVDPSTPPQIAQQSRRPPVGTGVPRIPLPRIAGNRDTARPPVSFPPDPSPRLKAKPVAAARLTAAQPDPAIAKQALTSRPLINPPDLNPPKIVHKSAADGQQRHDAASSEADLDIWPLYLEHALTEDKETVQAWNTDLDSILIFAALFSAVLTTLVIESYKNLQPDPQVEMMRAVLLQLQKNDNASESVQAPVPPFRLTSSAVRVNVYWFSSLILSLATALLAILAKQWVNYLLAGLSPVPAMQGRHRQYRMDGLHKWNLPALLSFLPLLLHIALLLFFAGLVDFVWEINGSVAIVSAVLVISAFLVYAATNLLSYIYPECPFKTSATVFISVGHDLGHMMYVKIALNTRLAWESMRTLSRHVSRILRAPRALGRRTLRVAVADLYQTKAHVESEKLKYNNTLRISSLRHQDERFISQNASLMDARVFLWLVHNSGRLENPEELGHALMRFPQLVRHRRLMIQEGAATFLERLLKSWFDGPWAKLRDRHRRGVASAVRTLSMLASEAEVDGAEYTEAAVPEGTVLDKTPFLPVQRVPHTNLFLSSHSLQLVGHHLLGQLGSLSLPLAAFALRLSVQLTEGDQAMIWARIGGNKVIEQFLQRIMLFKQEDQPASELTPAVNTVIYLALVDVSRRQRNGFALSPSGSPQTNDTRYWMTVLLNIMHRAPMNGILLRQICWGMCALSWSLLPQANGVALQPLIPRLQSMNNLSYSLMDLLSHDQDPEILSTVVVALERMLWNVGNTWEDHGDLCKALQLRYGRFLADLYQGLQSGKVPAFRISRILVSLTRIAAYLSFFDQNAFEDVRAPLTATVFSILRHLIAQKVSVPPPQASGPDEHPQPQESYVLDKATRIWIYRAACRIVVLYMDNPRWKLDYGGHDADDLIYAYDLDSVVAIGADMVSAVKTLSARHDEPRWRPLQPYTLDAFCSIMSHVFTQGLRPNSDLREIGGWDESAVRMVSEAVRTWGLLDVVLSSKRPCVHVDILVPAVHNIYTTLYAGDRPLRPLHARRPNQLKAVNVGTRYDQRHPAHEMAFALGNTFVPFLRKFTEEMRDGSHTYPAMHELLIELICIAGYLAYFEYPRELPQEEVEEAMVQYLRVLVRPGPAALPVKVRRHAWRALGSMAALYVQNVPALARGDIVRHFRCDRASPDELAVGFVWVMTIRNTQLQIHNEGGPKTHCSECALPEVAGRVKEQMRYVPKAIAEVALEMMSDIWDSTDWESVAIKNRLMHHGVGAQVRGLSAAAAAEGTVGSLAEKLATRIEMMPTNGVALERRLTM